jgi:hypothetical protein
MVCVVDGDRVFVSGELVGSVDLALGVARPVARPANLGVLVPDGGPGSVGVVVAGFLEAWDRFSVTMAGALSEFPAKVRVAVDLIVTPVDRLVADLVVEVEAMFGGVGSGAPPGAV